MKKNILIVFGGKSGEHEVSVRSAKSIEEKIDRSQFETRCLGITQDGRWNYGETIAQVTDGTKVIPPSVQVCLPSEANHSSLSIQTQQGLQPVSCDVIFPIIHGTNGEDGTLQGLLELSNYPYVGSNVLGSAVSMDKVVQKTICAYHNIPQARFEWFKKVDWEKDQAGIIKKVLQNLQLPLFVKPANLGSSVGISKVKAAADLVAAVNEALKYDHKVIVEEGINEILEVEVSVLGNEQPEASVCGSVKPNTEFYDYETKYITDDFVLNIPANIPAEAAEQIRQTAIKAFQVLNCSGLSRVDFFYQPDTGKYFLNELNTLPGFTSSSVYPKLWEASGVSYTELITKLIQLAEQKWQEKQELKYSYS